MFILISEILGRPILLIGPYFNLTFIYFQEQQKSDHNLFPIKSEMNYIDNNSKIQRKQCLIV